ncbi:MAG: XdhC family protein [Cyclobacteriaceae bacterium]
MKELKNILAAFDAIDFSTQKAALATVIKVQGSSYRRPGARMLINDNGHWTGAISGGCLEGDALRRARTVMQEGKPKIVTYDTLNDEEASQLGIGLGCNGVVDVLIEPLQDGKKDPTMCMLQRIVDADKVHVMATIINIEDELLTMPGGKICIINDKVQSSGSLPQALEEEVLQVLQETKKWDRSDIRKITYPEGQAEVLFELMRPAKRLILFGGGYDLNPLIAIAKVLGWQVTVSNDCPALSAPKRFPQADQVIFAERTTVQESFTYDEHTAIVLISHNYKYDLEVLRALLKLEIPYIGMLGPRRRFEKMHEELLVSGYTNQDFAKVHSPVGLNLGAETPEEIALAIVAEIQAVFKNRDGASLKSQDGFIHERIGEEQITLN